MIVDAHHHLWDPSRRAYPWMDAPALEPLRRVFAEPDLRAVAELAGVSATVAVQAVGDLGETLDLLAAAASSGLIAGVVGWVDLTAPDVAAALERLASAPGGDRLVGIRHQVHDEEDPAWLSRNDVRRGLEAVAAADLSYDLLVRARELPAALDVAQRMPHLRLVVDHGAKPDIAEGQWEPWREQLAALARLEQVRCKLSGLVTEAEWSSWRAEEVAPYAAALLDLFGPRRLMFGSDWPVCTLAAGYAEVLEVAERALEGCTPAERHAVLAGNAIEVYRLAVAS